MTDTNEIIRDKFAPAIHMVYKLAEVACRDNDSISVWQLVNEAMKLERIAQKIERIAPKA